MHVVRLEVSVVSAEIRFLPLYVDDLFGVSGI